MSPKKLLTVKSKVDYDQSFQNGQRLGRGAFGSVFQVVNRENGKVAAAIKHVDLTDENETIRRYARQEVGFLLSAMPNSLKECIFIKNC